jgi:hypothetical protein
VVSFTPRSLYPHGKSRWYPLDRRLGGPQSRSGRGGEEKNSQPAPGLEPPIHPARSPTVYHCAIPASPRYETGILTTTHQRSMYNLKNAEVIYFIGALSSGLKRPGREGDHSPPLSSGVKNARSLSPLPPYIFMAWRLVKQWIRFNGKVKAVIKSLCLTKHHHIRTYVGSGGVVLI